MWKTWTGSTEPAAPLSSPQSGGPMSGMMGAWHPQIWYLVALVAVEWLVAMWLLAHM